MFGKELSILIALWSALCAPVVYGKGDLTSQHPVTIKINLGNSKNHLKFFPSVITLETGKLYRIVLKNPSKQKHYFTSSSLASAVFTRKAQVISRNGKVIAEIKGRISEIEVYPGGTAEWWLVPIKTLSSAKLVCTIRGHEAGGMTGKITIK